MQQRADTVQGDEAIAADGPVVCESRKADELGSGAELVEKRVYEEQEQAEVERAYKGEAGPVLDFLGNGAVENKVDRTRKDGKNEALELSLAARGGETPSQPTPRNVVCVVRFRAIHGFPSSKKSTH